MYSYGVGKFEEVMEEEDGWKLFAPMCHYLQSALELSLRNGEPLHEMRLDRWHRMRSSDGG